MGLDHTVEMERPRRGNEPLRRRAGHETTEPQQISLSSSVHKFGNVFI